MCFINRGLKLYVLGDFELQFLMNSNNLLYFSFGTIILLVKYSSVLWKLCQILSLKNL